MQFEINTTISFGASEADTDYRVVVDEDGLYTIRMIEYKDGEPIYYSDVPEAPIGEDMDDLADDIDLMIAALEKPVLREVDGDLVEDDIED